MGGSLLSSIDRSLTQRARSNAAAAVRADARHAAERQEASVAIARRLHDPRPGSAAESR